MMVFVVSEPDALSTLITRKKREKRWENRVCVRPKKRRRQHCFVVWWELMVLSVQFSRSTKSISIELSLCLTFQGQKKRPKPSFLFPPFPPSVFGQTKCARGGGDRSKFSSLLRGSSSSHDNFFEPRAKKMGRLKNGSFPIPFRVFFLGRRGQKSASNSLFLSPLSHYSYFPNIFLSSPRDLGL